MSMRNEINWIVSRPEPLSCNTGQHTSSPRQPVRKKCTRPRARCTSSFQWHAVMDEHISNAPLPSAKSLSLNSLPGKAKPLQSDLPCAGTWEAAPHRVICVAAKIFHSSAQIASVIQIKAGGEEEALVPGIPWISLPTTKGLARAKLRGYCTATLWFRGDKGPFTTTGEPWGVWCGCLHGNTGLDSCKQLRHAVPQHLCCSCSA